MSLTKKSGSIRAAVFAVGIVGLVTAGLWFGAQFNSTQANTNNLTLAAAPAATFGGANLGAIPDAATGNCWGAFVPTPRNVTFNVSGVPGPPSNVELSTTHSPIHSWVGDVRATLIAPNGASHVVFARTGATTSGGSGDSSDLAGPYTFKDSAVGTNWWDEAFNRLSTEALTAGMYRTTGAGGAGQTDPAPVTNMTAAFAGVANPTGTWTLRMEDGCAGDTGSISAATLTVEGSMTPTAQQHVVDFDGNGKTDFALVRNISGGPDGQIRWFIGFNGAAGGFNPDWGIASDFFLPEDFDGDNKSDVAIWRTGAAGTAAFYILQSATNTVRIDTFGQNGDDPTVVGDYDGDGKADVAVYRSGASAGDQSIWYYRGSLTPANVNSIPWGQTGDFPAPGDYDGDGKNDFVIQRASGGSGVFWMNTTSAGISTITFGNSRDVVVPGDYDGDGKTDVAVVRDSGGSFVWYSRSSLTGAVSQANWGNSVTDITTQGDYDGDGKTDFAIWRPSSTPGMSAFWYLGSTSGAGVVAFGTEQDYPVANYNTH